MACPTSFVGPMPPVAKPATVCAPASSSTATTLVANVTEGASLTGVTLMVMAMMPEPLVPPLSESPLSNART